LYETGSIQLSSPVTKDLKAVMPDLIRHPVTSLDSAVVAPFGLKNCTKCPAIDGMTNKRHLTTDFTIWVTAYDGKRNQTEHYHSGL
jgi:hypothetical protein